MVFLSFVECLLRLLCSASLFCTTVCIRSYLTIRCKAGIRCDAKVENTDTLRQRLLSALVVPTNNDSACCNGHTSGVQSFKPDARVRLADRGGGRSSRVLDVTHLSLEQRVFVQLSGVGLFDNNVAYDQVRQYGSWYLPFFTSAFPFW